MKSILYIPVLLLFSSGALSQGLINNEAQIRITNGVNVVVSGVTNGDLTNGGTITSYGDLYIESDLTNNGTLINGSDATGDGRIKIDGSIAGSGTSIAERYYYDQSNNGTKADGRWWYITPSVSGVQSDSLADADYYHLFEYSESGNAWSQIIGQGNALNQMQGYATRVGSNQTIQYVGNDFFQGTLSIGLTAGNGGWNLAGNPYPCPIDFDLVGGGTAAIYDVIWTRTNSQFATYNTTSQTGTNGGTNLVAPMQAFWLWCTSAGTFEVSNAAKSMGSVSLLKSTQEKNHPEIRLRISNDVGGDEVVMAFMVGSEDGFERYDTEKRFGSSGAELFFPHESGRNLAVNIMPLVPEESIFPLGIKIDETGSYSISVDNFRNIPPGTGVFLDDLYTNESEELESEAAYTFDSDQGTITDRFVIRFVQKTITGVEEEAGAVLKPHIYSYRNMVNIHTGPFGMEPINLKVYDIQGKVMDSRVLEGSDFYSFPMDVKAGIYIIHTTGATHQYATKIVLSLPQ